jgi:hypothetical protein
MSSAGQRDPRDLFDADAEVVESANRRSLYARKRERCSMPGAP